MKWLVTGGCGFIGSSLINTLSKDKSNSIRIVDNLSVGAPSSISGRTTQIVEPENFHSLEWTEDTIQICVQDICVAEDALKIAVEADVIVHLAANTGVPQSVENPHKDCVTNVLGTLNYLEAARHCSVNKFIFASSGAPVGEVEPPIHEEIVPHPVSPYGASKLSGEAYCSVYFNCYGVETTALRFGNVYGPGSLHKSSVVAKFLNAIMKNETVTIYGDGSQTRDFIYIEDLIRAIQASTTKVNIGGEVFQIATSREVTVNEIVDTLFETAIELGLQRPELTYSSPRKGDVSRNFSDTSKAKKHLNWEANFELKDGLRQTVAWFIENPKPAK